MIKLPPPITEVAAAETLLLTELVNPIMGVLMGIANGCGINIAGVANVDGCCDDGDGCIIIILGINDGMATLAGGIIPMGIIILGILAEFKFIGLAKLKLLLLLLLFWFIIIIVIIADAAAVD